MRCRTSSPTTFARPHSAELLLAAVASAALVACADESSPSSEQGTATTVVEASSTYRDSPSFWLSLSDYSEGARGVLSRDADGNTQLRTWPEADQDLTVGVWDKRLFAFERSTGRIKTYGMRGLPERLEQDFLLLAPGGGSLNPRGLVSVDDGAALLVNLASNHLTQIRQGEGATLEPSAGPAMEAWLAAEDTDGFVDAEAALRIDDTIFVALGRYTFDFMTFSLKFHGAALALLDAETLEWKDADPATDEIDTLPLPLQNPIGGLLYWPSQARLAVLATGNYGALDGGLVTVDPETLQTAAPDACLESTLGRDLSSMTLLDDALYLLASSANPTAEAQRIGDAACSDVTVERFGELEAPEGLVALGVEGNAALAWQRNPEARALVRWEDGGDWEELSELPLPVYTAAPYTRQVLVE